MQQYESTLPSEQLRLGEIVGLIFPYAFCKKRTRKVMVQMKMVSRRYRPGAPPAGRGGGFYSVPKIRIETPEGLTWIEVSPSFYSLVKAGDPIFIVYQLSRRFRINQAIKAWPMDICFSRPFL